MSKKRRWRPFKVTVEWWNYDGLSGHRLIVDLGTGRPRLNAYVRRRENRRLMKGRRLFAAAERRGDLEAIDQIRKLYGPRPPAILPTFDKPHRAELVDDPRPVPDGSWGAPSGLWLSDGKTITAVSSLRFGFPACDLGGYDGGMQSDLVIKEPALYLEAVPDTSVSSPKTFMAAGYSASVMLEIEDQWETFAGTGPTKEAAIEGLAGAVPPTARAAVRDYMLDLMDGGNRILHGGPGSGPG